MIVPRPLLTDLLVDVPDVAVVWRPERSPRSRHWPRPDPCRDLDSFIVLRHLDLPGLDDDGLRDQLVIGRHALGSLLTRPRPGLGEAWARERLAAINAEMRERQAPPVGPLVAKSARIPRFTAQPVRRAP